MPSCAECSSAQCPVAPRSVLCIPFYAACGTDGVHLSSCCVPACMAACLRRPDLTQLVAAAVAAAAAAAMAYCTVHTVLYGCTHCALRMTMMVAASIHADGCMQIDITSAPHPVSASAACTESGRCKFSIGYNAPTGCSPHPFTLSVQEMAWLTSDGRTFDRACAPTCPSLPPSLLSAVAAGILLSVYLSLHSIHVCLSVCGWLLCPSYLLRM